MKKLLEHLTSIRDYLHLQEDILRRQEEEKFNKKINSLVLELCNYLNQDITKLSVSNNRYIVMLSRPYFEDKIICLDCKKAFILENNEIKEF